MISPLVQRFAGVWLSDAPAADGFCHGLEVEPSPNGDTGVARLLYWKPGRLGCSTCSSDVARVELSEETAPGWDAALSGDVPLLAPGAMQKVRLSLKLASSADANGILELGSGRANIALKSSDVLPPFDIAPEG